MITGAKLCENDQSTKAEHDLHTAYQFTRELLKLETPPPLPPSTHCTVIRYLSIVDAENGNLRQALGRAAQARDCVTRLSEASPDRDYLPVLADIDEQIRHLSQTLEEKE